MKEDRFSRRKLLMALGAASALALGSGISGCTGSRTISDINNTTNATAPASNLSYRISGNVSACFAEYVPLPVSITPALADYSAPADLSGVLYLDEAGIDAAGKAALARQLFYMRPSRASQIYEIYKEANEAQQPVFVTTDAVLHAYHVLFDFILRKIEEDKLSLAAIELMKRMLDESIEQYDADVEGLKEACLKNCSFFAVACDLLGEDISHAPQEARRLALSELGLIRAHRGFAKSTIFGVDEDYSQYVPRGHYTRSKALENYFMAMMWCGRISFGLYRRTPTGHEPDKERTRQAILITLALKDNAFDLWKLIYDTTTFFVGSSDDLSVYDYRQLIGDVFGDSISMSDLVEDGPILTFISRADALKEPKIISTLVYDYEDREITEGLRFMGQRFVPDSYIFQELVRDRVGDASAWRNFPMGLDVMAVLGSKRAYDLLDSTYNETRYLHYKAQFQMLKEQFAALEADTWTQNLYWGWLYCLQALLNEKGDGYPAFMKSQAWSDKELNTGLGSWTELRHDTILYTKQSYATLGLEMGRPKKGYVEPNPELYGRLASLVKMTCDGLRARGLLLDQFSYQLDSFNDLLVRLKTIAEKELTGTEISAEEDDLLGNIGIRLRDINKFSTYASGIITSNTDEKMPVIADVHTDPNSNQVLEEAVGHPYHIFVIVPMDGKLVLTRGGAFSYYEFKQPVADRLTDEAWQSMLASGRAPEPPEWTKSFLG